MRAIVAYAGVGLAGMLVFLANRGFAQPYGDWSWSFVGDRAGAIALGVVPHRGSIGTLVPSRILPSNAHFVSATHDVGNFRYAMTLNSSVQNASLLLLSRGGGIMVTVQVSSRSPQQGGGFAYDVASDQDGTFVVAVGNGLSTTGCELYRVNSGFQVSTILAGAPLKDPRSIVRDIDTGDFLVTESMNGRVFKVSRNGSAVSLMSTMFTLRFSQTEQDVVSGDLLAGGGGTSSGTLLRMDRQGRVNTIRVGVRAVAVHPDRASAPGRLVAVANESGIFSVDLANTVVTTLARMPPGGTMVHHVFPVRELSCLGSSGHFLIYLSFPVVDAWKPYVVALSLSGVRPGVLLPDGRRIPLNVDALTLLSVFGGLGPLLTFGGYIDPLGRGLGHLDVSRFPDLSGLRVWAVAVSLDPAAPLGLSTISDPLLIVL